MPSLGELFPVQDPFQRHIIDAGVRSAAMVLVAFLVTFCIVRAITHAIRRGAHGVGNVSVGGIHVHHMVLMDPLQVCPREIVKILFL